jgi:hypothetical protein
MDVRAILDADGRLHVTESQAMVFTGDWNGGERIFRVSPGQSHGPAGCRAGHCRRDRASS